VISLASVCGDFCWSLLLFLFFFLLKTVFHIASLHTWVHNSVSATRISLLASLSFINSFPALAQYPQSSALFRLLCMTQHRQKHNTSQVFYSDSKTDLKLRCDCSTKFQLFEGAQNIVTRLMAVCCMYPITPTDYPSTTRGMSMSHTVAVNINFWALVLSELYG
jgi:hypothetical protein